MKMKWLLVLALLLCAMMLMTACVPGDGKYNENKPANFLSGIWHGWIAPISLIIEIFNPNIRVYEPINTGFWYDFGFYIAVISGFGGVALTRRARHGHKHKDED